MTEQLTPVCLRQCSSYRPPELDGSISGIVLRLLAAHGNLHGKKLLLKPNLISSRAVNLACTHPEFVAAVVRALSDCGAKIVLGDSPAFGSAVGVCAKHGITEAVKEFGVQIVEFATPVKKVLPSGVEIAVAKEALECDLFVGLPKVKAHNQLYVTLAVKNIFGIVKGTNKALLHMVRGKNHDYFAGIILELISLLPPQFHVCDGISAMHISGPLDGEALPLHCVGGASSPVALDCAIGSSIGADMTKSPLQRVAVARNLAGSTKEQLSFPFEHPSCFQGVHFVFPESLNPIRFNPFRFLLSAVKRTVLKATG